MFKTLQLMSGLALFCLLCACGVKPSDPNTVRVGTIAGPETELMEVAKEVALQHGLTIEIVTFSNYPMPNAALQDGSIDANMFQHQPYLEADSQAHGYDLVTVAKTFVYPMAIYSKKISSLQQVAPKSMVAIPNDPSNGARALLLLEKAGLIKVKVGVIQPSLLDIIDNPHQLQIKEMDAAQLPRVLDDIPLAVINTNWAVSAGLLPKRDGLFVEDKNSPYANILVVRRADKDQEKIKRLIDALHSEKVKETANSLFEGQAIQAW